ncbi:flagellin [Rhodobacter lacus]|uniref:Flagellin n=1 Tax=Rhodobacter lacus TaxID=1641972 RepID=A0ABW5A5S9_9RHOB
MSSINTNSSAMVALQTLKGINSNLSKTQSEISTGKSVASAKDNSAIWAISKVMESDVAGFETVSTNLATGQSMVSVARTAAESITKDLTSIKEKIVAGQDPSADKGKLDNEIAELVNMIDSKVKGAQFNGVNLISAGATGTSVLASIDRSGSTVSTNSISIAAQDLSTAAAASATGQVAAGTAGGNLTTSGGNDGSVTIGAGTTEAIAVSALAVNESLAVTVGGKTFSYTVTADDVTSGSDLNDLAMSNIASQINSAGITGLTANYDPATAAGELGINAAAGSTFNMAVTVRGAGTGALAGLAGYNSSSSIAGIEAMINASVDAAAAFGAAESRIESQASFVSDLTSAMKSGIGSLVDADMEEASARLQALQTQQQLGIQALSIANQQPQSILSLFR